jgi:hypothetical protein
MTTAVIQFAEHLGVKTLSQTPRKLILLRNKLLIDYMKSCYIPDLMSRKSFIKETAKTKMWNWENYIDTISFSVN